jgi:hypothetical protein
MTKYAIVNQDKTVWLCKDKTSYSLTTDKAKAVIFESKPAAETVFKSNLSKLIKSKGVTVQTVNLQIAGAEAKPEPKVVVVKEQPSPTHSTESSKYIISVLSEAAAKLNVRHQELSEQQSKFDGQVSDIVHYIEFNTGKLNACDGYKAYKLLQDTLVERRKVKDELQIIQTVRDRMNAEDIANVEQKIKELEARTYKPRELTYLFEKEETV